MQRDGYAAAAVNPHVIQAIRSGAHTDTGKPLTNEDLVENMRQRWPNATDDEWQKIRDELVKEMEEWL